jgi:E3 Ubiquitin ligase
LASIAKPGALLTSEISGTPCVWYRYEVKQRSRRTTVDRKGRQKTKQVTKTVTKFRSQAPFLVRDATGAVAVRVREDGLLDDAMERVVNKFEPHTDKATGHASGAVTATSGSSEEILGYETTEWVLRPGVQLYVHGEADDKRGHLAFGKPNGGPFLVSTKTEDDLRKDHRFGHRVFSVGSVVVGLAGVALVISGALGG